MDAPIVTATLQSAALGALSNLLGQLITAYQTGRPFSLDLASLVTFVLFSFLNCPPNYLWQSWLEASFPGYTARLTPREKESLVDEAVSGRSTAVDADRAGDVGSRKAGGKATTKSVADDGEGKKKLSVRNTLVKFALDQTVGAAVNTILFIASMGLLRNQPLPAILTNVQNGFWPMVFAGQKFWPIISILNFTLIPLERRMLFGAAAGVVWGIYLNLLTTKKS